MPLTAECFRTFFGRAQRRPVWKTASASPNVGTISTDLSMPCHAACAPCSMPKAAINHLHIVSSRSCPHTEPLEQVIVHIYDTPNAHLCRGWQASDAVANPVQTWDSIARQRLVPQATLSLHWALMLHACHEMSVGAGSPEDAKGVLVRG